MSKKRRIGRGETKCELQLCGKKGNDDRDGESKRMYGWLM